MDTEITLVESAIDDAEECVAKIANLFFDKGGGWAASMGLHSKLMSVVNEYFGKENQNDQEPVRCGAIEDLGDIEFNDKWEEDE